LEKSMTSRRALLMAGLVLPASATMDAAAQALAGAPGSAAPAGPTGLPPGTPAPAFYTTKGEPVWEIVKPTGETIYSMTPPAPGEAAAAVRSAPAVSPPPPVLSPPPPPVTVATPTQPMPSEPVLAGAPSKPLPPPPPPTTRPREEATFSQEEIVTAAAGFLGATAQAAAAAVERIFRDQGRPVGYIAGEEGAGAWVVGLRYGKGTMFLKTGPSRTVYWQGPSIGLDFGGNASKSFTLIYGLTDPEAIFRRFGGVEGSAYFIGGIGVNYQRQDNIILAPMRAGVGVRAGAAIGYLSYSRERRLLPV
jgi:hypothetical protein